MNLSLQFLSASILGSCLFVFTIGYYWRSFIVNKSEMDYSLKRILSSLVGCSGHFQTTNGECNASKHIYWSLYSSESVDGIDTEMNLGQRFHESSAEIKMNASNSQQILMDLKTSDSVSLRLAKAVETSLLTFIDKLGIVNFSYRCQEKFSRKGVSCVGHAGKISISVQTWSEMGLLSLSVLNIAHGTLDSVVELASQTFAFSNEVSDSHSGVHSVTWAIRQRGLNNFNWMTYEPAQHIHVREHDTSRIDGYDISSSGINDLSFEPLLSPRRNTQFEIKDNDQQLNYEVIYPETLVHPAMFAHDEPKRVAILGNGTGTTLCEVLKHRTVEQVVIIGHDLNYVEYSRVISPKFSDCSNLEGSSHFCFDDARVDLINHDLLRWLADEDDDSDAIENNFDVVIFERSDDLWNFQDDLEELFHNLLEVLSEDGVFVIPHGPPESNIEQNVLATLIAAEESVHDILVYPTTTSLIDEMINFLKPSEYLQYSILFHAYLFGYGFAFEYFGEPGYLVDTGILTFINHGCNGMEVMGEGEPLTSTKMTVDREQMPPELMNYSTECHTYNPFIDQNNMRIITAGDKTLFDIKKGSELLDNYLRYLHKDNWKMGVLDYRAQCIASAKGVVTGY